MLLRFSVQNFRSFQDEVELSMVATRFSDTPDYRIATEGTEHGVLPAVGVYGANASGKSNLIFALTRMLHEVVTSYVPRGPDDLIPYEPFALDPVSKSQPTKMSVDFVFEGVRYHYGFRYQETHIVEEWLYAYPGARQQVWFHRNHEDDAEPFYFGPNLKGQKKAIEESTRPNSLFLSTAAQYNHKQLLPLYRWFSQRWKKSTGHRPVGVPMFSKRSVLLDDERQSVVRNLLQQADLGVVDFRSKEHPELLSEIDDKDLPSELLSKFRQQFEQDPPMTIELSHQSAQGPVFLDSEQESHGTHLLLSHGNLILSALSNGTVLLFDEFDAGLHPQICASLLALFTSSESNPKGAQLIFSAHSESLLDHLRRDEIVFVDKDQKGRTSLVPLAEFDTRKRDDIRQGYHDGRFGGVPILGDLVSVVAEAVGDHKHNR